jgi:sRNA-binding carbon storage regulator CsrA
MLTLSRQHKQTVTIRVPPEAVRDGQDAIIVVSVQRLGEKKCRLGFEADTRIRIERDDLPLESRGA